MLNKEDIKELIDITYNYGCKLIKKWDEAKLGHIRLKTSNIRHQSQAEYNDRINEISYKNKWIMRHKSGNYKQ